MIGKKVRWVQKEVALESIKVRMEAGEGIVDQGDNSWAIEWETIVHKEVVFNVKDGFFFGQAPSSATDDGTTIKGNCL